MLILITAQGQTPDTVIVFVNFPSGARFAFVGDLVFQNEGSELRADRPWLMTQLIGERRDTVHEDIARIHSARAEYSILGVIPAHDGKAFEAIPIFPASIR